MNYKKNISSIKYFVDHIISKIYLSIFHEKNYLIIFFFHGLFCNKEEFSLNAVDPHNVITIEQFRKFIEYYLEHNYTFISPYDILEGLNKNKKYVLITFDDGYYNNKNALPILKEYKVPAVFFISTNHVKHKKCFWWDVLFRQRIKQNISLKDIYYEKKLMKSKTNDEIEKFLINTFGEEVLKPISDLDRPFTISELKDFSKEKYVFLGNHTSDHAILTNYSLEGIKFQILNAQNEIYEFTGIKSVIISYPDGKYSDEVIRICKEIGLKLGTTVEYGKNKLPAKFNDNSSMSLKRLDFPAGKDILKSCNIFRSDVSIRTLRTIINNFLGRIIK